MLCSSFTADGVYLACGFENGFAVYQCHPFRKLFSRTFQKGGIGLVEILGHSNILAMVGGGKQPLFSPNTVMIWDDAKARFVGEINVNTKVLHVCITSKTLVVVTIQKTYIYELCSLRKQQEYLTAENEYGLVAINSKAIVIPGKDRGALRILSDNSGLLHLDAHDNGIRNVTLSYSGSLLASVSEKGTLIRLYNVNNGERIQVFRRGIDKASISHLIISRDEKYLVCVTEGQTLYLFQISENVNATSLTTIFTTENKYLSKLSLTFVISSLYMNDISSLYIVSISGVLYRVLLNGDYQLICESENTLTLCIVFNKHTTSLLHFPESLA